MSTREPTVTATTVRGAPPEGRTGRRAARSWSAQGPKSSTEGRVVDHSPSPTLTSPSWLGHSSSYRLAAVDRSRLTSDLRQSGDRAWSTDPSVLACQRRTRGGSPRHGRTCCGAAVPPGRHPVRSPHDLTGTPGSHPRRRIRTRCRAADDLPGPQRPGTRPSPGVRARRGASSPESGRNRSVRLPMLRAPGRDAEPTTTACLPAPLTEGNSVLSSRSVPRRGAPSAACSPSAASREGGSLLVTSCCG